MHLPAQTL
jgi:transposase InsO family protein